MAPLLVKVFLNCSRVSQHHGKATRVYKRLSTTRRGASRYTILCLAEPNDTCLVWKQSCEAEGKLEICRQPAGYAGQRSANEEPALRASVAVFDNFKDRLFWEKRHFITF